MCARQILNRRVLAVTLLVLGLLVSVGWGQSDGRPAEPAPIQQAQAEKPPPSPQPAPAAPSTSETPSPQPPPSPQPAPTPAAPGGMSELSGLRGPNDPGLVQSLSPSRQAEATTPASNVVQGGPASQLVSSSDAGDLLRKSESSVGVETQRRSPIANESRIRGYRLGELSTVADGAFWFPARLDLDTFLSKIDSGNIDNIIVLKGPYSVLYGPGFAFIDIETKPTDRSDCFEAHGRTVFDYETNGRAFYGRQDISTSDKNWGMRLSYGQRTAQDYHTGNDLEMPSMYDSRDFNAVFGFDLEPKSRIELGYMHLDQTKLFFPGQIFDTDVLGTDGYRARLLSEDQDLYDRLVIDGWYNRTFLRGNAQEFPERLLIPQLNASFPVLVPGDGVVTVPGLNFIGFTQINQASAGYRIAMTWGKEKEPQFTLGTDLRWLSGVIKEEDTFFNFNCVNTVTGVPESHSGTIGFFGEGIYPCNCCLTLKGGVRADIVTSDIDQLGSPTDCATLASVLGTTRFERTAGLFLGYGTAEYKLAPEWTLTGGLATAQRPATTTELYANQLILAVLQQGFTTVVGNPDLAPERLYQIDIGIKGEYERVRVGANGFYSFVNDYITYEPQGFAQNGLVFGTQANLALTGALTVRYVNTNLATLEGAEAYGEVDATDWLTPFATVAFVETRDYTVGSHYIPVNGMIPAHPSQEPLPGIAPLESRFGLKVHEPRKNPRYGVEFSARAVAHQERVAESLGEKPSAGFIIYDIRGYWQVRKGFLLTAGVENVFDRNYREHLDLLTGQPFGPGVFQPGVNGYFGVELRY
jgi:iron complex outermembrane recepter protein